MNREELLAAIRKIVGRKFEFSETYTKNCGGYPTLGANEITYSILTRKYVYIPCRVTFGRNEEGEVVRISITIHFVSILTELTLQRLSTSNFSQKICGKSITTFFSISGGKNQCVYQRLRKNMPSVKSMLTFSIR